MRRLFKCDHYPILEDIVYTHNFEIYCGTDQVRLLFKMRQVNSVYFPIAAVAYTVRTYIHYIVAAIIRCGYIFYRVVVCILLMP